MLAKLSSTERVRFTINGQEPRYYNALLKIASEQHPVVSAVKHAEKSLAAPR